MSWLRDTGASGRFGPYKAGNTPHIGEIVFIGEGLYPQRVAWIVGYHPWRG